MHPVFLTSTSSCCSQCTRVTPTQSLQIEGSRSSPKWRHRGEDSSTGEMPPMPTSPGEDLQNPTAQNALFSSLPQIHSSAIPLDFDVSSPLTYCTLSSLVEGTPRSGVRCIPVRQRPDLGSARKCLQVNLQSDGAAAEDTVAS
jgi:DNA replication licensing factor MCM4